MDQSPWRVNVTRYLQEGETPERFPGEPWKFASGPTTTFRKLADVVNKPLPGCRLGDNDNAQVVGCRPSKCSPSGTRLPAAPRRPARPARQRSR